jgi:hypothetical protein
MLEHLKTMEAERGELIAQKTEMENLLHNSVQTPKIELNPSAPDSELSG